MTPGIDCVRIMGDVVMPAAERDLVCEPDNGDVVRGRYGRDVEGDQKGEIGEEDITGSVDRRM